MYKICMVIDRRKLLAGCQMPAFTGTLVCTPVTCLTNIQSLVVATTPHLVFERFKSVSVTKFYCRSCRDTETAAVCTFMVSVHLFLHHTIIFYFFYKRTNCAPGHEGKLPLKVFL